MDDPKHAEIKIYTSEVDPSIEGTNRGLIWAK